MNQDIIDAFDGKQIQSSLAAETDNAASDGADRATQICLIALASDGFVVIHGNDSGRDAFTDGDITEIFLTFADTLDAYPGADTSTLRLACAAALAGLWQPCSAALSCPFDLGADPQTRLIFHVHSPGWGFEDARIKFKTDLPDGAFTGLAWLTLNGLSCAPRSFKIDINTAAESKSPYEFALFIEASQDAGQQSTRVIIDPKISVPPPPPPNP